MEDKTTLSPQSWLPLQAAPVDRRPGSAALNGGSGVEAAGIGRKVADVRTPHKPF